MRPVAVAALVLALGPLAVGCGTARSDPTPASNTRTAPTGTVEGRLVAVGGPAPGRARPLRGSVRLTRAPGVSAPYVERVGRDGTFSLHLPAGRYRVLGNSPDFGNGAYACFASGPVQVSAGRTTHVDVVCPMR